MEETINPFRNIKDRVGTCLATKLMISDCEILASGFLTTKAIGTSPATSSKALNHKS